MPNFVVLYQYSHIGERVHVLNMMNSIGGYFVFRWGTGMIASISTFRPHLGRVIRDMFRLLDAVYGIVRKQ